MNNVFSRVIAAIDCFTEWTGRSVSWLVLAMVIVICYDVAMRYLFQQGSVALQELEWHLFALLFLLSGAYTLKHDEHVRVDIVFQSRLLSDKHRALINIAGIVLFLFPFCGLILYAGWSFAENAYFYNEGSPDPGGLPNRYLLKGSILLAFALLIIQGIAELLRNILKLQNTENN
ncbi:C4-dicarboxylate ABC transporter permease [Methylophaga sp. 41_12_T18]|nr:C4-dicarboxylate ABC transporter permease [Methylophaga sp. 41_12_T18]